MQSNSERMAGCGVWPKFVYACTGLRRTLRSRNDSADIGSYLPESLVAAPDLDAQVDAELGAELPKRLLKRLLKWLLKKTGSLLKGLLKRLL